MTELTEADQVKIRSLFDTVENAVAASGHEFAGNWETGKIAVGSVCLPTISGDLATRIGLEPEGTLDDDFMHWLGRVEVSNFVQGISLRRTPAGFILMHSTVQSLSGGMRYNYAANVVAALDDPGSHLSVYEQGYVLAGSDGQTLSSGHTLRTNEEPTGLLSPILVGASFTAKLSATMQTIEDATEIIQYPQ